MNQRVIIFCVVASSLSSPAWAGAPPSMSPEQVELLNEANAQLRVEDPDLDAAGDVVSRALEVGPRFDVLLLTYGRILQKQDRCEEAKRIFNEIDEAPNEPSISPADIKRLRSRYSDQFEQLCSARLVVSCASDATELFIGEEELVCEEPAKLPPGGYELRAVVPGKEKTYDLSLRGGQEVTFRVTLVAASRPPLGEEVRDGAGAGEIEDTAVSAAPSRGAMWVGAVAGVVAGVSAGGYFYARRAKADVLEGLIVERDGEDYWRADISAEDRAAAQASADRYGYMELTTLGTMTGAVVVGGVLTALIWRRGVVEETERVSIDASVGAERVYGGVRLSW